MQQHHVSLKEYAKHFKFTVHPSDYLGSAARSRHQQIEEKAVDDEHEHHNDLNCFELLHQDELHHLEVQITGAPTPRRKQRL